MTTRRLLMHQHFIVPMTLFVAIAGGCGDSSGAPAGSGGTAGEAGIGRRRRGSGWHSRCCRRWRRSRCGRYRRRRGCGTPVVNALALVANQDSDTASVLDLTTSPVVVTSTVNVGKSPSGVAIGVLSP